jgi:hypothetical protein
VTGFVGGTYNKFGQFYAVRQGDAHSWVEGYIDGRGWLTFDPTPPAAAVPQSDIDGMLAELRMFFEAVSQSWNHHVLGYDLRQQVGLFESLSSRNRGIGSLLRKPSSRSMLLATGLLILLACAYWLYRRRRHRLQEGDDETTEKTKDAALATSLYQALDVVMIALGIARSSSTPPLRHAEVLTGSGHPDADLIMQLTMRYLDARFGRHPLTAQDRQAFESGMRRLKEQGSGKPRSGRGSATPKAARLQTGEAQPDDEAQTDEAQTAPTSGTRHSMPPDDARDEATRQSGEVLTHPPRHDDDEPPSDEGA